MPLLPAKIKSCLKGETVIRYNGVLYTKVLDTLNLFLLHIFWICLTAG